VVSLGHSKILHSVFVFIVPYKLRVQNLVTVLYQVLHATGSYTLLITGNETVDSSCISFWSH